MMNEPHYVSMPADELSTILKNAHEGKQDNLTSCGVLAAGFGIGLLAFSLSVYVWFHLIF